MSLLGLHLVGKEVIVLSQLLSRSILVTESLVHLPELLETLSRERKEPVVGAVLETGQEYMTQEQVIVRVDCYLVLLLAEMLDGNGCS